MFGPPLRDRLSPKARAWLALIIFLFPIITSAISGVFLLYNPTYKITISFELAGEVAVRWAVILPLAFYLIGFQDVLLFWGAFRGMDVFWGLCWFVVIRVAAFLFVIPVAIILFLLFPSVIAAQKHRAHELLPWDLFRSEPLLGLLLFTLISMIAGFCEESWRYGMFKVISQLMPKTFYSEQGKIGIILIVSIIFGSAHIYEGITGVLQANIMGVGLAIVMIYRRSFWQAALAHFFIDGMVGPLLYLLVYFQLDTKL